MKVECTLCGAECENVLPGLEVLEKLQEIGVVTLINLHSSLSYILGSKL